MSVYWVHNFKCCHMENFKSMNQLKIFTVNGKSDCALGFCYAPHSFQLYLVFFQLRQQMENANFESGASILSSEQIQETVRRRVSPLFMPR